MKWDGGMLKCGPESGVEVLRPVPTPTEDADWDSAWRLNRASNVQGLGFKRQVGQGIYFSLLEMGLEVFIGRLSGLIKC